MSIKKILGIGLSILMGLSMIGCSNGIDTTEHMVTKKCEETYKKCKKIDYKNLNDAIKKDVDLELFKGYNVCVTGKVENLTYNEETGDIEGYLDVKNNKTDKPFKFIIPGEICDIKFKQGDTITVFGYDQEYWTKGNFKIETEIIQK